MPKIRVRTYTVVYLVANLRVWLAKKSRKLAVNLYNGYGGGKKPGEFLGHSALRELREESCCRGLGVVPDPKSLKKVAVFDFLAVDKDDQPVIRRVHFYVLTRWRGRPVETREMKAPKLFSISRLPLKQMMLPDRLFLPRLLKGEKLKGWFRYNRAETKILGKHIEVTGRWRK